MNLFALLQNRVAAGKPVRAGLIGAGKFGSMFLAQAAKTPGLEVAAIADIDPERARAACRAVGWDEERIAATRFLESGAELLASSEVEVAIEATGHPAAGVGHARAAAREGKHIVMVNVEADVLAGPLLAEECRRAGVVYSMAYGDQPALICEMVDWARACGLEVVAAGKGTKHRPEYHASTPDTIWGYYGIAPEDAKAGGMNPKMFNSFLDGTKSGIEMAAVANATGLAVPRGGLGFPPCDVDELAEVLRPKTAGGRLEGSGLVEVISSERPEGGPVARDLRWGVYTVFAAPSDYTARCFREYGLKTDSSGRYAAMYKPFHLIGLELGISVLSVALRGEATGATRRFAGDVVAVAKRALKSGEILDGEGGYCVWGRLMPAEISVARGAVPIGLAQNVPLIRDLAEGEVVTWSDVQADENLAAYKVRQEMVSRFAPPAAAAK